MPRVFFYILIIYLSLLQKNLLLGRFLLSRWTDRLGCLLASRVENHHGHSHGSKLFLGSQRADQKKSDQHGPQFNQCVEPKVRRNQKCKLQINFFTLFFIINLV